MADFIIELAPNKGDEALLEPSFVTTVPTPAMHPALVWELYVDESSNDQGSGAGLILTSLEPKRLRIEYALRLDFKASNNEMEYEALLVGLRLAKVVGVRHLHIFSDSQLVVRQVSQDY